MKLLLALIVPAVLGAVGLIVPRRHRRLCWALAIASLPLVSLLAVNLAALPDTLIADPASSTTSFSAPTLQDSAPIQAQTQALPETHLVHKMQTLFLAGVLPGVLAWLLVRRQATPLAGDPERGVLSRMAGVSGLTLTVAMGLALGIAGIELLPGQVQSAIGMGLWANASTAVAIGLSLGAAVAEELLFRGVLLLALLPWLGRWGSAAAQAAVFGLIHAAYGDPWYLVGAGLFGLGQAWVVYRYGLMAAVMVHAQVNFVILGWSSRAASSTNEVLVVLLLMANLLVFLPYAMKRLGERWHEVTAASEPGRMA